MTMSQKIDGIPFPSPCDPEVDYILKFVCNLETMEYDPVIVVDGGAARFRGEMLNPLNWFRRRHGRCRGCRGQKVQQS